MGRRWGKIEKDFCTKNKTYDISKIPDIYDCIKYDLQHNQHTLQFDLAEELYIYAKYLADIVIPQVRIIILSNFLSQSYLIMLTCTTNVTCDSVCVNLNNLNRSLLFCLEGSFFQKRRTPFYPYGTHKYKFLYLLLKK